LADTPIVLSLVTADQSLSVARAAARQIAKATLFCDMNSVAPATKRAAGSAIEGAGGRYVDVAIMAPVHPQRLGVPILLSGPDAEAAAELLRELGFSKVRCVGSTVGEASSIKMIRSVIVKGIEALTAEAMLAAYQAGVTEEVLASLDASEKAQGWAERADYNLDRMLIHGRRRAEEVEEALRTLEDLGVSPP
jgi:3-hydroxyisobutyrate dehydrogenase-like beta-hydroxyacid dehydrogenase